MLLPRPSRDDDRAWPLLTKAIDNREQWVPRPDFDRALDKVLQLLPDEMHMRELLQPINDGGKERMRELAVRTRQYRKFFEAWEDLHLVHDSDKDDVYVRDDVIQYIRFKMGPDSNMVEAQTRPNDSQDSDDIASAASSSSSSALARTLRGYETYRAFLAKMAELLFPFTAPYFGDHMTLHVDSRRGGRGIVLTAGNEQAPYLLTTIWSYRRLGCTLPIEVMFLGDTDMGQVARAELEALPGVITRDLAAMVRDEGWTLAGWAAKPFAILMSSFREVLFIDADSIFFRDPEIMFDDPQYKETAALFFRDRLIFPESKMRFLQSIFPRPIPTAAKKTRFWTGESGHQQESGVIVVDKWEHFISLLLVCRLNGSDRDTRDGKQGVYELMFGTSRFGSSAR